MWKVALDGLVTLGGEPAGSYGERSRFSPTATRRMRYRRSNRTDSSCVN